uniref:Uncharacterized protein n=1 Tax=Candidozyma auris TaxID=498019 RepID=A0A0L0P4N1_CANAR
MAINLFIDIKKTEIPSSGKAFPVMAFLILYVACVWICVGKVILWS